MGHRGHAPVFLTGTLLVYRSRFLESFKSILRRDHEVICSLGYIETSVTHSSISVILLLIGGKKVNVRQRPLGDPKRLAIGQTDEASVIAQSLHMRFYMLSVTHTKYSSDQSRIPPTRHRCWSRYPPEKCSSISYLDLFQHAHNLLVIGLSQLSTYSSLSFIITFFEIELVTPCQAAFHNPSIDLS